MNGATTYGALMAVTRNSTAAYFIPTENEWYKAAFYKGGGTNAGYWTYATRSNVVPSNVLSATGTNNANFFDGSTYTDPVNFLTPVGAFAASPSPYGTFDQQGDVFQYNEDLQTFGRTFRGCDFGHNITEDNKTFWADPDPMWAFPNGGFRVASSVAVPEPTSIALLLAGAVALGICRQRRNT